MPAKAANSAALIPSPQNSSGWQNTHSLSGVFAIGIDFGQDNSNLRAGPAVLALAPLDLQDL